MLIGPGAHLLATSWVCPLLWSLQLIDPCPSQLFDLLLGYGAMSCNLTIFTVYMVNITGAYAAYGRPEHMHIGYDLNTAAATIKAYWNTILQNLSLQ